MQAGAEGFVGYKEPFMFPYDEFSVSKPLADEKARPCLESSNQVALALIKGASTRDAHLQGIRMFRRKITEMLTTRAPNSYILAFLYWNMINQVYQ